MKEYGLFNDEGCVEDQFYSREEAEEALRTRYTDEDGLRIEEVIDDEDDSDEDEDEADDDDN